MERTKSGLLKKIAIVGMLGAGTLMLEGCATGPTYKFTDESGKVHEVYQGFDYTDGKYVVPQTFSPPPFIFIPQR